ncbi:hypothetical protein GX51_06640 [Blastomyces parvus]|uniref:Peroxin-11C n=1 Tax=Blastomyces parvus TaxID=2060905 RepID=A0A2B7WQK6_9EURO|nr:hypothetical protein GX51_06640 [Blastomyces parvus]
MGELSESTTQAEDAKAPPAAVQASSPVPPPKVESQSNDTSSGARSSPLPKSKCHCAAGKRVVARSDVLIRRLDQFISTATGQERLLAMIQYNSQIIHYFLLSPPLRSTLARLRSIFLPAKPGAGVAKSPPSPSQQQTPPLLALSALLSETRTTLRLLGLLSLWSWGSATLKSPPADPLLRTVAYAQVAVNVVYQVLENVAHLAGKGVVSRRAVERWGSVGKWYVWSTRAWLGHVLLEFVRVWREYVLARDRRRRRRRGGGGGDREKIGEDEGEGEMQVRGWKKSIVNSLAWLPLCVHWSFEDGVGVPDKMVGVLSMTASAWGVYDMWNATAKMT